MNKPDEGALLPTPEAKGALDATELSDARVRVRALRDRMPEAYYGGLFNGFAYIIADPDYETRNPAIYPNPLPHLGKNKQLMGALMGKEGGDDAKLTEMIGRVRGVHQKYGIMRDGFIADEHADVFRYIVGTLAFKAIAAFEAQQQSSLDPQDRQAVVTMFQWIGKELGLRESGTADELSAFVEDYDKQRILAEAVKISDAAREAIKILVSDTTQPDALNPDQRLAALAPALREKIGLPSAAE